MGQVYRWPSVRLRDLRQRRCALPTVTAVYGEAVRALAGWEAEVLLTIGTGAYPAVVGTPPSNVRIERWVDQNQVFVHSALDHGRVGPKLGGVLASHVRRPSSDSDPARVSRRA